MSTSDRLNLSREGDFGCSTCKTHIATIHSMISEHFNGKHGGANLFDSVVNVVDKGEPYDLPMTTGLHTIQDVNCRKCGTTLGSRYIKAHERSQKYKEGKYLLERNFLVNIQ